MWVREALVDPKVLQPVVTSELRAFVIQTMFMLSATNQRRFKAFLSDLCKVAASELPVDTLGAFA
jgi:predicted transcriptional regulator with HTH domain